MKILYSWLLSTRACKQYTLVTKYLSLMVLYTNECKNIDASL